MAAKQQIAVTILGVDKITAVVDRVNKKLLTMNEPTKQLTKALKTFGAESGLSRIAKNFANVGHAVARVGHQIKHTAERLAEFVGIGGVAGIAAMTIEWGRLGFEITRTANAIGVSTTTLQEWRQAGIASGVGAEAAQAGLAAMGKTLEDATYGRNQQALVMMNRLNIHMHRLASGAVDADDGLKQLAEGIKAQGGNRQAQQLIADQFGVGQLLPMLLKGKEGIEEYEAAARQMGSIMSPQQVATADKFGEAMIRMHLAADGFRNTIADRLIPVVQPLLDKFTNWLANADNRQWVSNAIVDFVKWLSVELPKLAHDVKWVVDEMGGLKTVAIGLGLVIGASVLAPIAGLSLALLKLAGSTIPVAVTGLRLLGTEMGYVGGGFGASMAGLITLGLVGGAAAAGGALGYGIYRATDDTSFGRNSGRQMAGLLSHVPFFGQGAKNALAAERNNPGNLRSWGDAPRSGGFAMFADPQSGLNAMARQLQLYAGRGNDTIGGIINTYAPSSDSNDDASYISDVTSRTGLNPSAHLADESGQIPIPILAQIEKAMVRHENAGGLGADYNDSQFKVAAEGSRQDIHLHITGLPKGVQVAAGSPTGKVTTSTAGGPLP